MCFDCIFDNIYKGVTVNQIADELNITPQYLSKLFREEVGVRSLISLCQKDTSG